MGFARKGASLFARGYDSLPGAPFRSFGFANALRCLQWGLFASQMRLQMRFAVCWQGCFAPCLLQGCFAPCFVCKFGWCVGKLFVFYPPFVVFDGEGVFFVEWEVLSLLSFVAVFDVYAMLVGYLVDGIFFLLGE